MFGKKSVVSWIVGIASAALPAFSQSESPEKNDVSVQAFGSLVKSTTDNGIENKTTDSGGVLGGYRYFSDSHNGVEALYAGLAFAFVASVSPCQQTPLADPTQPGAAQGSEDNNPQPAESKRILGIIPNYRTSPSLKNHQPLTPGEKFKIASEDAFDRGTVVLAALFGGEGQLTNANRSFGQGGASFGRYFGAAYGDLVIGDYMTEGIFPTLLHQDPRYFRRGTGAGWSRLGYAMGQIFWTHRDSGGTQFNYSEVIGNSAAAAISTAYYANSRTATDAVSKLGMQLGVDMAANILKEFWPEVERKVRRKHSRETFTNKSN